MKKTIVALMVLGISLATAQAADKPASKEAPKPPEPEKMDPNGKPTDYKPNQSPARYAIWFDGTHWNLHMTSAKNDLHYFNATVEAIGGKFTTAQFTKVDNALPLVTVRNPNGKGTAKIPNPNFPQPTGIIFKKEKSIFVFVQTAGGGSESSIQITPDSDTTLLQFSLQIDGKDHHDQILIGAKGEHPAKTTFTLVPNPPKKEKSK
jgi:hypothetical protein